MAKLTKTFAVTVKYPDSLNKGEVRRIKALVKQGADSELSAELGEGISVKIAEVDEAAES